MECFPKVQKEILKLNRAYIANVINTICGQAFRDWTSTRINARNSKVKDDKDMNI